MYARKKGRIVTNDDWVDVFCFDLRLGDGFKICQFPTLIFCIFIVIFIVSRGYIYRRSLSGRSSPWAFFFMGWLIWALSRIGMSWTHCDVPTAKGKNGVLWDVSWLIKNIGEGVATIFAILAMRHDLGWMSWPNGKWCTAATILLATCVGLFTHSIFLKKNEGEVERELCIYIYEILSLIVNVYMIHFCRVNNCFTNRVGKALVMITILNLADSVLVFAHIPISPCLGYFLQTVQIVLAWYYVYWTRRMLKGVDDISESIIEEVDDIIRNSTTIDFWDSPLGGRRTPIQSRIPQHNSVPTTIHSDTQFDWHQTI